MISSNAVFESVRRGYNDLEQASNSDIVSYFEDVDADSMIGHVSNIKGILFEQQYVDLLATRGIDAEIFEATNHPVTDISILDDGEVINELQLKATDSVSYINATLDAHPDVEIVTTTEVAANFDNPMVIDSGIEDAVLESAVVDTLVDDVVNPVSPLSVLSLLVGLPF
jgi:DNA-binding NarL/FixJ family response regulator